jgi:hypothetical protein
MLYFLSGEISKKFTFLGFLKVPTHILDVMINNVNKDDTSGVLASIVVLVKGMMLLYDITTFFF